MNPEFDQNRDDDPTTPFDEPFAPSRDADEGGLTEPMPLPEWAESAPVADTPDEQAASPVVPVDPAPTLASAQPPSFFGSSPTPSPAPATDVVAPQPPPPAATPAPPAPAPPAPSVPAAPTAPATTSTYRGPTTPNYSAAPSTAFELPERKSFTPSTPPNPPEGPGQKPRRDGAISRWGWRSLVAFLAGGLIAAAGFAAGEINDPDDQFAGSTPTSIVVQSPGANPASSVVVETGEPAAVVAERLGPSVVQIETNFGLGSGVVYRDGYIITNNHVIEDATSITIRLSNGENFDAILVGADASKDLAVLSVGEGRNLPVAELALDSEVRVGQIAVAIGSPFQLQQTVTAGIVSAVNRPVPSRTAEIYVAMIQTDAPINPGNSGGALADKDGRVIGINTAIQTDGFATTNAGVGFAIPIEDAVRIADKLVAGEPIEPGFLGVSGTAPENGAAGVEIVDVNSGSAAEAAGLMPGDRVLSLDGAPVADIRELAGMVLAQQAGDQVTLQVIRDGVEIELDAVLGIRE